MKIDKNSYGTVLLVWILGAAAIAASIKFISPLFLQIPVMLVVAAICIWQTLFHIVPARRREGDSNKVSAVADGEIIILEKAFEKEFLKCECMMVSIYMDFWDVHANFWPMDGEVSYAKYHPGKHFLAFLPKASEDNEHSCTCIRNKEGRSVFYKQIAGGFARRIVSYAVPGLATEAGKQCGIIKFGSRIDMYLPLDSDIKVKIGDTVRACETVIAEI